MVAHRLFSFALRAAAAATLALAMPALAETTLPVLPGEDDRVTVAMTATTAPTDGLPALVQMAAAVPDVGVAVSDVRAADATELDCLATAVWFESRGETLEGQLAVAQTVVNRARSGRWGKGMCGVIKAPRQYNFAASRVQRGTATFTTALAIARIAAAGLWHDMAAGAHSFHAARISPRWRLTRVAKIGNHVFYR